MKTTPLFNRPLQWDTDLIRRYAKQLNTYEQLIDAGQLPLIRGFTLGKENKLRQYVINQIICHFHLDFADVEKQFGISVEDHFAAELSQLVWCNK